MFTVHIIESSFPLFLSDRMDYDFRIINSSLKNKTLLRKNSFFIKFSFLRYFKYILTVLRFDIYIQGSSLGLINKISSKISVLSDGMLSEYLYHKNLFHVNSFTSVFDIKKEFISWNKVQKKIILGNNYIELGSMSENNYVSILRHINENYPGYYYYPHPKENISLIRQVFIDKFISNNQPFESYILKNGVPTNVISIAPSTCITSILLLSDYKIDVSICKIPLKYFDGPINVLVDYYLHNKGITIDINMLTDFISDMLLDRNYRLKILTID
jgi:hypothetical protein